jgi:hypothetical protein
MRKWGQATVLSLQTGCGVHPAPCAVDAREHFSGSESGQGTKPTTSPPPHVVLRLGIWGATLHRPTHSWRGVYVSSGTIVFAITINVYMTLCRTWCSCSCDFDENYGWTVHQVCSLGKQTSHTPQGIFCYTSLSYKQWVLTYSEMIQVNLKISTNQPWKQLRSSNKLAWPPIEIVT